MNEETVLRSTESVKYQYLTAVVVNLFVIGYGVMSGWVSPILITLTSDDSPLSFGKLTNDEVSWVVSLLGFGCIPSVIIFGFISNKFGRKMPLIATSIPMIISWLLILFAQNVYYLYVARVMHGMIISGIIVIAPVFLIEIANDRIRGALGSTMILTAHFGVVIAFILGSYCSYNTIPIFMFVLTAIFVIFFMYFPESPMFLMKQNKVAEAENAIRFYQNLRSGLEDDKLVQVEIEKLRNAIGNSKTKKNEESSLKWSDLTTNPGRRAMLIAFMLAALNQFSGGYALMNYTTLFFNEAGSSLSTNDSTIIVGFIQFIGTCVLVLLVDRAGRKIMYIISTIGTAIGLATLGIYIMLKNSGHEVEMYNWIPLVSLSFGIFCASLAVLTLPFTVIVELMPEKIKEFGVTVALTFMTLCSFTILKFLPLLNEFLGFHGSMFLFTGVCLFSTILIIIFMPETKGKSHEEIMKSLQ